MSTVALVGRPNVGKSTLFNRLTGRRDALVADRPGLTRDRQYGRADIDGEAVIVIDTGGLLGDLGDVSFLMEDQVQQAVDEADVVIFMVDARDGLTAIDQDIAIDLRRRGASVLLVANKIDGAREDVAMSEFAILGLDTPLLLSAVHGHGMAELRSTLTADLSTQRARAMETGDTESTPDGMRDPISAVGIKVAVIGRPNVGKSTLVNRLLGEERQVVFAEPGTTRDAIFVPFVSGERDYVLIDTAGIRRKGKVSDMVEKFSVIKTLRALDQAQVAMLLVDAREGVVEQDLHLMEYAMDAGTGLVLVVNKWDGLTRYERDMAKATLDRRMNFAPWVPIRFVSALHGTGVGHLMRHVDRVYDAGAFDVQTAQLTRVLTRALVDHPPPLVRGRAIKLRYAHKVGDHPPSVLLHGNQTERLPASYLRYLENRFREAFDLVGMPIKIECRTSTNPFAGKKNVLTRRQKIRRKRIIRHRRGR
ncbi:MAG: ribosome biogenesis GTPase Der [Gammaproteobacteria bacterium]|nr:ribosome biogenesis GTPase Der [Gammaproteobacteria bacterium]